MGSGGSSTFTYQNPEKATSYGAEVEMRKKLDFANVLKNFTFQANASYIHSRVEDANLALDRPLQGQSPYVLNFGLLYDLPEPGFNATLLFNQIGERIYVVGTSSNVGGSPDVYEAQDLCLIFNLPKKLLKTREK